MSFIYCHLNFHANLLRPWRFPLIIILYLFHILIRDPGGSMSQVVGIPTTHTSLSPIRRGFAPGFVNYKKGYTRHSAASDKVYQLLAHGRWFSPGTPASSTTKTGRHDIAEILLKVALNTKNQSKINHINKTFYIFHLQIIRTFTRKGIILN